MSPPLLRSPSIRGALARAAVLLAAFAVAATAAWPAAAQNVLNPGTLTKFMDPLPIPGAMPSIAPNAYEIGMYEVTQQLHSQLPPTRVWGYGTSATTASYPAATIEATRGVPITVRWTNHLPMTHLLAYAIDSTLRLAECTAGIPVVAHVHGGEQSPQADGGPETWFTQNFAEKGPAWTSETFTYPNEQLPATIWYHDHAMGITRLNVYAGLAGFYIIRDPAIEAPLNLPSGPYEIPLAIQDRQFLTDGSLYYPVGGENPEIHPIWQPENFGDVILVNGKVWPYLNVEPRKYRFRVLDGSNARFYALQLFQDVVGTPGPPFWQIGSDGGYLDTPVMLNDPANLNAPRLLLAPGERADIIIDFSGYTPGTTLTLRNNAKAPYPSGDADDPQTVGQIMQFRVVPLTSPDGSSIATPGAGYVTRLTGATTTRNIILNEVQGPDGPVRVMINDTPYDAPCTELPTLGSTEIWEFVNTTADAHPMHLHLVQFQLLNRQKFAAMRYLRAWKRTGSIPDVNGYLQGRTIAPDPNETGWKDTYKCYPGQVTRVIVRFAPQDGSASFGFDATAEPGYVYHCHILEHEENDMMRPYKVQAPLPPRASLAGTSVPVTVARAALRLSAVPNPVLDQAAIRFTLPEAGTVRLEVFDVGGRLVHTLASGSFAAGSHTVTWDRATGVVKDGIYFVRLDAGGATLTHRLVVVK